MQHRDKRVADAIRDSVAEIILNKLSDPGIGFVTVTRCRISRDLRNATVYISALGSEEQRKKSLEHIQHAAGRIRRLVGGEIKLRHVPELHFALDELLLHERRINEVLSAMEPAPTPDEEPEQPC